MKNIMVSPIFLGAIIVALIISLGVLLQTQQVTEDSSQGFVLPEGDMIQGKQAFVDLGCVNCHRVHGVELSAVPNVPSELVVPLGGERPAVVSYGRLVTMIIHPSKSILRNAEKYISADGKSLMPEYKSVMTVEQVADLVGFLQQYYTVGLPADYYQYPSIYP